MATKKLFVMISADRKRRGASKASIPLVARIEKIAQKKLHRRGRWHRFYGRKV